VTGIDEIKAVMWGPVTGIDEIKAVWLGACDWNR